MDLSQRVRRMACALACSFAVFVRTFAVCFLLNDVDDAVFWWVCAWRVKLHVVACHIYVRRECFRAGEKCFGRWSRGFVPLT